MKDDVLAAAPPTGVRFEQGTEVARLVNTLAQLYYRIDDDISTLRRSRFIESATGRELDLIGLSVNVYRPDGEADPKFRRRVFAGFAAAQSRTTFEDFARVCLKVLDADPSDVRLTKDWASDLGTIIVRVRSTVLDGSPFTTDTITELLEQAAPMSRRVAIQLTDVATFGDPDRGWGTQFGGDITSD
ncbi:hypothetical protein SAMN05216388_1017100 [Halorientalis persicus]|uniref:Uncharacterized protein n=1 Tax=Halorientalis persicus TaxID=1367881 RepID=A0A1H8RZB5_9EURY|nr:hypothetical protein [Halorientalis persicus]SEO72029.1 hypothetical protein SAMN05216388_1017100 [Halorientalis persicus]